MPDGQHVRALCISASDRVAGELRPIKGAHPRLTSNAVFDSAYIRARIEDLETGELERGPSLVGPRATVLGQGRGCPR